MPRRGEMSNQAEMKARREKCLAYFLDNLPNYTQFRSWFMAKFDKQHNTAVTDWKWVCDNVSSEGETKIGVKRWRRIQQLDEQYQEADNPKDKANIVMMAAKLEGVDINRHEIDANVNSPKSIFKIDLDNEKHEDVGTD